jgi:hypothetical protein
MNGLINEGANYGFGAWLCIASAGASTRVGDNFNEIIGETYIWPKSIPQAHNLRVGDIIALWDTNRLLGFSWIETIDEIVETREQYRCPNDECRRLDMRERTTLLPRFKCGKCASETDHPIIEVSEQESYRATYGAGWVAFDEFVDAETCRLLTKNPNTQHSLREIDIPLFEDFVGSLPKVKTSPFRSRYSGHVRATVRVRVGQSAFRQKLRSRFGDVCAITGPNHSTALEAAHLYSYAEYGEHHDDGGLLLRRDIHRLFDSGLISVNPKSLTIDVHADLASFEQYSQMHGKQLSADVSPGVVRWLSLHWDEYRT